MRLMVALAAVAWLAALVSLVLSYATLTAG